MTNESAPLTNGETPSSRVLSHLNTYPVVHDSVELYKSNPYGAKTLSLAHQTYTRLTQSPFAPYLQTPLAYLSPYLSAADTRLDSGLSTLESKLPIVKEDTSKLKEYAFAPYKYLLGTWEDEYSKTRGQDGLVKTGKAVLSLELKVVSDACVAFLGYWNKGKETTQKKVEEIKQ
ncbi:hypothetical protein P153DRAFT_361362 [Dothidotthia symphoricarpi CBS 119687]|uniref:CAP20-like protein n=1 Tax=Dothidotthia symphoricarpi CBS 119687 TaxID=1392245 RepID=A0A6A5ZZ78_9PLEO|nr:uncharacterized protein P153DRAFT_361362 [Dothidotthia symphoricarpi CBS 119687]KAF2124183.1 hypothetical protein P153DRAFT_361362 [Dothidotthia symphoricarpi CBS 119687]